MATPASLSTQTNLDNPLFDYIRQYAIDSEGNPVTPDEIPAVANLLVRRWMNHALFREMVVECLDDLRFK